MHRETLIQTPGSPPHAPMPASPTVVLAWINQRSSSYCARKHPPTFPLDGPLWNGTPRSYTPLVLQHRQRIPHPFVPPRQFPYLRTNCLPNTTTSSLRFPIRHFPPSHRHRNSHRPHSHYQDHLPTLASAQHYDASPAMPTCPTSCSSSCLCCPLSWVNNRRCERGIFCSAVWWTSSSILLNASTSAG